MTDSEQKAWEFAEKVLGVAHEALRLIHGKDEAPVDVPDEIPLTAPPKVQRFRNLVTDAVNFIEYRRSASALLYRAFAALPREPFAELLGHIAEEGQRLAKSTKRCEMPLCTLPAHENGPHEDSNGMAFYVGTTKPAPDCLTPGCEKSTGHAPPHEPCGAKPAPQPSGNSGELPGNRKVVRRLGPCPTCGESMLHVSGCAMGIIESGVVPEPLHDFGWALQQMRAGKKVRREAWEDRSAFVSARAGLLKMNGTNSDFTPWESTVFATDWQVVE